ncbi:hypothetical protein [Paenibacillus sp. NPDC057967]|uniref:hypothetical protein n=1 Tax=Paenibacillus sp. NPDC057967 TaxID=3346293 RepID=UPI0036D80B5E
MRRQWIMAVMLIGLLISGCTYEREVSVTNESLLETESTRLRAQLEQLQAELRASEKNAAAWKAKLEANQATPSVTEQYPKLAFLASLPEMEKIEIRDELGSVFITDSDVLSSVSHLFAVQSTIQPGSPPMPDVEPVELVLTTDQGVVRARIIQRNIIQFEEMYPNEYYVANSDVYLLAKAFMHRPQYVPAEQSTTLKMIDSGLMRVDADVYLTHPGRMLAMAKAFFYLENKAVEKPVDPAMLEMALTFYYYGEEIKLHLYRNHAQLLDGEQEIWFELQEGDLASMKSIINAG